MSARFWATLWALAVVPSTATAQGLAARVAEMDEGTLRVEFPVRKGVQICSQGIRLDEERIQWRGEDRSDRERCTVGPARVDLRVSRGRVVDVDLLTLDERGRSDAVTLGAVGAGEAVEFFSTVARAGDNRGAREALLPMMLADVPEVWRRLMALAQDREVAREVRKGALFWLGQEAASAATAGLESVVRHADEEQDVRDAAIFALSRRPADEGLPILMDLARTAPEAQTRRAAFFWLAQSEDPRVVPFFKAVLTGRPGG